MDKYCTGEVIFLLNSFCVIWRSLVLVSYVNSTAFDQFDTQRTYSTIPEHISICYCHIILIPAVDYVVLCVYTLNIATMILCKDI